jgi:hypothetical protein
MAKNKKDNQQNLEIKTQEVLNELSKLTPDELKKLNLDLEIERLKKNIIFNKLFSDDEPQFNLSTLILIGLQALMLIILIFKIK